MFCCIEEVCGVGGMTLCTRRGSPASDSLVLLGSVSNSDLPAVSGSASPILLHDHETSGGLPLLLRRPLYCTDGKVGAQAGREHD